MTSSCTVSSLNSLITTETLINLSAFFPPPWKTRRFSFFFLLISACSFHFTEGKVPFCHVGHFSCPVFNTTRLEDGEIVHKFSPHLPRIWKRKMMQKHWLQTWPSQMSDPDYLHLLCDPNRPATATSDYFFSTPKCSKILSRVCHNPLFLASLLYQFGERQKRLIAAGIKHVFVT